MDDPERTSLCFINKIWKISSKDSEASEQLGEKKEREIQTIQTERQTDRQIENQTDRKAGRYSISKKQTHEAPLSATLVDQQLVCSVVMFQPLEGKA